MTLRRVLCALLGGHDLGRVPVWRDGRARLQCQLGCGYETEGIEAPESRPLPAKTPVVRLVKGRRVKAAKG